MLCSLLAILVTALGDVPMVLEGPSTLELGLIGGGVLVAYALASRAMGRRRARGSAAESVTPTASPSERAAAVEAGSEKEHSRPAA